MKIVLGLIGLCITLPLSHGYLFFRALVPHYRCIDPVDGSKYPFGSMWDTKTECLRCTCNKEVMECHARYGEVVNVAGCKAVVDPKTCRYEFYEEDDPSKPCAVMKA